KDAGKIAEAAKLYAELPEGSYYRDKGKQAFDDMKEAFLKEREGEAKALKDKGQCDRIPGLARRSAEEFPQAKQRVHRAGAGRTGGGGARGGGGGEGRGSRTRGIVPPPKRATPTRSSRRRKTRLGSKAGRRRSRSRTRF